MKAEAIQGALAALRRGSVGWAFIARDDWNVPVSRLRPVVLGAADRCEDSELPGLALGLARVGGRRAQRLVERIFEQVVSRIPRGSDERERLYEAAALLRLAPGRS